LIEPITPESNLSFEFTRENFFQLIQDSRTDVKAESKAQIEYLYGYLNHLHCRTIICEQKYIDKYYLDDYVHFYSTCFVYYPRTCTRLHFFNAEITLDDLINHDSEYEKKLQTSYLGFTVIKPIPNLMGRTLVKVYEDTNCNTDSGSNPECRHILTLRKYSSNLFGNELSIESLAFQEQDQIISACATSALWSVLEKTAYQYDYYLPTPFEITKAANKSFSVNRPMPSSGLNLIQVINAIKEYGMEVEVTDLEENPEKSLTLEDFLGLCYAYLRGGFPIFLGVQITEDFHALAMLGYHLLEDQPVQAVFPLIGNKIDKFYIHDDNIGPFAKYEVQPSSSLNHLILTCEDRKEGGEAIEIKPESIVIPLYHKIRYPYSEIRVLLDQIYSLIIDSKIQDETKWEWDCYISSVNQLKKEYLHSPIIKTLPQQKRNELLLGFFPRFIWRTTLLFDGTPVMELLFDATEAKTRLPLFEIISYIPSFSRKMSELLNADSANDYLLKEGLLDFLKNNIEKDLQNIQDTQDTE
jgi:hypothetical protein